MKYLILYCLRTSVMHFTPASCQAGNVRDIGPVGLKMCTV